MSRIVIKEQGQMVSGYAIVRALIRYASQQGPAAAAGLFLLVEKEMQRDFMWGKKT